MGRITSFNSIGAVILGLIGAAIGAPGGREIAMIGALVGGAIGFVFWRFPIGLVFLPLNRLGVGGDPMKRKTIEELRARIRDPEFPDPTAMLLELGARAEGLEQEMPFVLDRLTSRHQEIRSAGWQVLQVVYPSRARLLSDFRVEDTPAECEPKVDRLRSTPTCAPPRGGPARTAGNSEATEGPPSVS